MMERWYICNKIEQAQDFFKLDEKDAEIQLKMLAKDIFIVSDSSKFGKTELTNICCPSQIQHIATNNDLGIQFQNEFKKAGIDLILA